MMNAFRYTYVGATCHMHWWLLITQYNKKRKSAHDRIVLDWLSGDPEFYWRRPVGYGKCGVLHFGVNNLRANGSHIVLSHSASPASQWWKHWAIDMSIFCHSFLALARTDQSIEWKLIYSGWVGGSGWSVLSSGRRFTGKKYPYIHGYFVASFPYFNGTVSVYVFIRKSTE